MASMERAQQVYCSKGKGDFGGRTRRSCEHLKIINYWGNGVTLRHKMVSLSILQWDTSWAGLMMGLAQVILIL